MKKLFNELYNADMERYKKTVGGGYKEDLDPRLYQEIPLLFAENANNRK